jgi:hypothetical protein
MTQDATLPVPIDNGNGRVSTLDQLAEIPEEEIWLQKQKSARTRRAYRLQALRSPRLQSGKSSLIFCDVLIVHDRGRFVGKKQTRYRVQRLL